MTTAQSRDHVIVSERKYYVSHGPSIRKRYAEQMLSRFLNFKLRLELAAFFKELRACLQLTF